MMPLDPRGRSNHWLTCLTVDPERSGATAGDILDALEAANIEGRPVWKPMHLQPLFAGARTLGGAVAQELFERGLCLPSGTALSAEQRDRVIRTALGVADR